MHEEFGTYGAWLHPALGDARVDYAAELETLGFRTIWLGIGAAPVGDMRLLEQTLAHTRDAHVASAIINMWQDDANDVARHYHRLVDRHGPRLLLGVGLGHPESRSSYDKPYQRIVDYVDTLLYQGVPCAAVVIAALGTKTLQLAGDRTRGSHPYLTVPAHTRHARETMGPSAFLAPEHKVVLTDDPDQGRRIGRPVIEKPYLGLRNYTNNLKRHGFTDADVAGSGSDRLIDALVAHGSPEAVHRRLDEHLTAGADHVGVHVITENYATSPMPAYRALAAERRPGQ